MTDAAERPSDQVIIEHKDGRTYSVTRKAAANLYPDFKVVRLEVESDFVVTGVPKPKAPRKRPKAKAAAPVVVPVESAPALPDSTPPDVNGW